MSRQNQSGSCVRRRHFPACNSELSKGIFEEAKGLLMNRLFIDLWTKQSLIMCRAAFNWGRRTSPLLAERLRGGEWRAFDRVFCHRGEGWGPITQPCYCAFFSPTLRTGLYFCCRLKSPLCVSVGQAVRLGGWFCCAIKKETVPQCSHYLSTPPHLMLTLLTWSIISNRNRELIFYSSSGNRYEIHLPTST